MSNSDFLYHTRCPACAEQGRDRNGDNFAVYSNNSAYCFSCGHSEREVDVTNIKRTETIRANPEFISGFYSSLSQRAISEKTCKFYGYQQGWYRNGVPCQIASFYEQGRILVQKLRLPHKDFKIIGDKSKLTLWGKHLWTTGKKLTITEGELDCLSVAEEQDCKWPTVSLPNGSGGAKKILSQEIEWITNNFEEVVLFFDNDEPGQAAAKECALLFPTGFAKIAKMASFKDPNEALIAGRGNEIVRAIWQASPYQPDGIIRAKDTWEIAKTPFTKDAWYPWDKLNELTHGLRLGEIVTICAGSGIGKSLLAKEIIWPIVKEGQNVAYIGLEESIKKSAFDFMSFEAGKLLHLEDEISEEDLASYWSAALNRDNLYMYDHWGSISSDSLINRLRYFVSGCGVRWVVLDHISIAVSGLAEGNERRIIDNLMTNIATLVKELNFGLILVSHLKRSDDTPHEEGGKVSLADLRGSGAIGQVSYTVIGMERDQQDEAKKNITKLKVLKNRFAGQTGFAGTLQYNPETGRLSEENAFGY